MTFAVFGLGIAELVVLAMMGCVALFAWSNFARRHRSAVRGDLREEVEHLRRQVVLLRDEIEKLRDENERQRTNAPTKDTGIQSSNLREE